MFNQRFIALLACIALVGGIAWAAVESQEVGLAGASGIDAVLVPGAEGAELCVFAEWAEEIKFSVRLEPDGSVTVNGEVVGSTDAGHTHHIRVDLMETPEGFEASVTVTDEDLGVVVAMQSGFGLGVDAPAKACASGEAVLSLTAE